MYLSPEETRLYIIVLIGVALLGIFISYFFVTMFRQYQAKRKLQFALMKAEIDTLEKERSRIARDMHDEFSPMLSAVLLQLDGLQDLTDTNKVLVDRSEQCVQQLLASVRTIILDLEPVSLRRHGLRYALQELESDLNASGSLECNIFCADIELPVGQTAVHVYRMISEILHNARKHAEASELMVQLRADKNHWLITAADNGRGFDFKKTLTGSKGLGLKNIVSRIQFMNGEYAVQSDPSKGTAYKIRIPFKTNTVTDGTNN